ncbi:sulfatase family protein [Membranihabitans maritimus]|uniref:sulfatase family protein n=1 Tax=Membranihabitans maritimus TaxID=2904244 RepID=UPI001F027C0C|nr:sulfatase-like hydrolase/transferase [Membranihabitans maritimus]
MVYSRFQICILIVILCCYNGFSQQKQPNVIFILADDLGWGDLQVYGHEIIQTPNLDRLVENGLVLSNFYVNSSVCSPSRAAFMTGVYPSRLGIHGHLASKEQNQRRDMADFLNPEVVTITDIFQQSGYATAHFGKWHLGHTEEAPLPSAYGIDQFKTNTSNDTAIFDLWLPSNRPKSSKMVVDEAIGFIHDNREDPFFINAWFVDPHAVLNPSEEQMEPYKRYSPASYTERVYDAPIGHKGATQIYYATVTEMDRQIGRLIDALDSMALLENTILIFTSDNGPEVLEISNASHSAAGSVGPFRGCKRSLYEGGIRMPFIMSWPGHIPRGYIDRESVVSAIDFLPTLCAMADVRVPGDLSIDGEDRSAVLLGNRGSRMKPLFWEWRFNVFGRHLDKSPQLAMRDGKWKLLMNPDSSRMELYDLSTDPSELQNVASRHRSVVREMREQLFSWYRELPPGHVDKNAGKMDYSWP